MRRLPVAGFVPGVPGLFPALLAAPPRRAAHLLARAKVLLDAGVDVVGECAGGAGRATALVVQGRNKRLDPYRGVRVGEAAHPGPPGTAAGGKGKGKPTPPPPKPPDHFSALKVARGATMADLRRAYKERALTEHPDKGGDKTRFQAVEEAHRVLTDPARRGAYERAVARWGS